MSDAVVQLPADGAGKKLDAETLTVGANTVFRERIQLAGAAATDIAPVTAADGVLVNLGTNNDVGLNAGTNNIGDVDVLTLPALPTGTNSIGQVTANAGTNLNTAALALEAGNLATAVASLSVMDDWDESDRAKVNPIAGQAGVQGGSGAVSALTQRVVLATDVALPTGTNSIGQVTANAGTNLNTALLALESGGNLATAVASLSVIDDWDETDRAKVNPIVGVAGVAAGSGASSTSTQRIISATDDPGVTALQIMDDWDESDRAKVNLIVGQAGVAAGSGASGATVQRVVQANDAGKTLVSAGGSAASSGNNTLVAAGTNKIKVIAFSLTTVSTTAMTCIFQSGASGTELWRVVLQAATGTSTGANLSIALPGYLFATAAATLLNLNLSSANAVHWSVTYYDEA